MNYAIGNSYINTSPYAAYLQSLNPAGRSNFEFNPDIGYEMYLKSLGLSNTQERTLRSAYNSFLSQYQATDSGQGFGDYRWVDFLRNLDPNRELARMGPSGRSEQPERFSGRSRWITF